MRFIARKTFSKSMDAMPVEMKEKLKDALKLLQENPNHPLLHIKPLKGKFTGFYSFRVSHDWRVTFYPIDKETICLVDVANRKDIYK